MGFGEPFPLMDGEEILIETRPHPLAMLDLMLFWLFIGGLGVGFTVYFPELQARLTEAVKLEIFARYSYEIIWFASLILPLVIMAVFRINFGYVITLLLLIAGNLYLRFKVAPRYGLEDARLENLMLMAVGVVGILGVELFRRGHRYYVTTHRIVARFGSLRVSERSTLYSKIDDLMLQQTILGKLLNFGTVIPITAAGLGMGQDLAIAGAGAGAGKAGLKAGVFAAGGKAKNVPRELSIYVLFRVSDPDEARNVILEEMEARERPRRKRRRDVEEDDE